MEHLSKFSYTKFKKLRGCAAFVTRIMQFNLSAVLSVKGLPINMPSLSPTMMEGNIVKWMKKEGDVVEPGDILCDIQTDKAVASLDTEESGILAKILIQEDSKTVTVGTPIALLVEEGEDWKNVEMPEMMSEQPQTQDAAKVESPHQSHSPSVGKYGPSVRLLLQKYGLPEDKVPATGPRGVTLKRDILHYVKENNIQPIDLEKVASQDHHSPAGKVEKPKVSKVAVTPAGASYRDIELTDYMKATTMQIINSKLGVAHTYSSFDCSLDAVMKLVKEFKKDSKMEIHERDFVIKAVSSILRTSPQVNCFWQNNQLVQKEDVDMNVAVPTEFGVIKATIERADRLGLEEISAATKDLIDRAANNQLRVDQSHKGTFTIFDLGMFGVKEFRAIINSPECAVLALGESRIELNDMNEPEARMTVTLSYDQGAISDDDAAYFLGHLKAVLENPNLILFGHFSKKSEMASLHL